MLPVRHCETFPYSPNVPILRISASRHERSIVMTMVSAVFMVMVMVMIVIVIVIVIIMAVFTVMLVLPLLLLPVTRP